MQVLASLGWSAQISRKPGDPVTNSTRGKVLEMVAAARMAAQAGCKVRCKVWRSSGSPTDVAKAKSKRRRELIFEVSGLGSASNLGAKVTATALEVRDSQGGPSYRFPIRVSTQRVTGTLALAAAACFWLGDGYWLTPGRSGVPTATSI